MEEKHRLTRHEDKAETTKGTRAVDRSTAVTGASGADGQGRWAGELQTREGGRLRSGLGTTGQTRG